MRLINEREIIEANMPQRHSADLLHTRFKSVFYEEDKTANLYGDYTFHNSDRLATRESLIVEKMELPVVSRFKDQLVDKERDRRNDSLNHTRERAGIDINLSEYFRLQHLCNFEEMFRKEVGLVEWNFANRIYVESLTTLQLSQCLAEKIKEEPEILTRYDPQTGALYIGLFFKSPAGRMLYKQWQADKTSIPSYTSYLKMTPEQKATQNKYFNLAEDQSGNIGEKRTVIMPADGSRIDVRVSSIMFREIPRVVIHKRDIVISLKASVPVAENAIRQLLKRDMKNKLAAKADEDENENGEVPEGQIRIEEDPEEQAKEGEEARSEEDKAKEIEEEEEEQEEADSNLELNKKAKEIHRTLGETGEIVFEFKYGVKLFFESAFVKVDE